MTNEKKFRIANRISFIFFSLYLLTYIFLPIIEKNANYLWFLGFPLLFLIALIINLLIKYDSIKPRNMEKVSKGAAILNILFNGSNLNTVAGSLYAGTTDWDVKKEEIKKYPSITPTWLFVLLFTTILVNGSSLIIAYDKNPQSLNLWLNFSGTSIIIASIISIIFILLGMVSSTFALYYNNGKKETIRFLKIIIIVVIGLIIIVIYSAYSTGFSIKDEINKKHDKDIFEQHKQNIENILNNNK